jgi:hypothetical protein
MAAVIPARGRVRSRNPPHDLIEAKRLNRWNDLNEKID